jgi:hypothetical protein
VITTKQDREFGTAIIELIQSREFLSAAIKWISANLSPEDVFPERELREWAKENGFSEVEQQA